MLASDVLGVCRSTLLDPSPGTYWTDAELLSYLNQFIAWACGLKPDLNVQRQYVDLVAGVDQTIPADGQQFIDATYAGNGQAVMVLDLATIKHTKFANLAAAAPVTNVKVVTADERDPKRFQTFPRSDGTGTLQILYSAIPAALTTTGATYPLGSESTDAAYAYVVSVAYAKNTDRQDLTKSTSFYQRAMMWFGARTQIQLAVAPKDDA